MVKKKTVHKKKRKSTKKNSPYKTELKKIVTGLVLLLILVVVAGILTHYFFLRQPALKHIKPAKEYPLSSQVEHKTPPFEVFPEESPLQRKTSIGKRNIPLKRPLPRVAIIIDDLGYQKKLAERLFIWMQC